MIRLALAMAMTAILTLAAAAALNVQPPNALADGPGADPADAMVRAAVAGCVEGLGLAKVETQAGIVRVETGERLPHVRHLNAIAKALGCGTRDLIPPRAA